MKNVRQRIHRILIRINITSIFFFVLSLISVTLAWFAFSNIVTNNMEVSIKAWNISINDENGEVNNSLAISLDEFYPGVDTYTKTVSVHNNGDLPGIFSYNIKKIRILDQEYPIDNDILLNQLSQDFPFAFNFSTDTNHLEPGKTLHLNITISWPLDSGNDMADSDWGNKTAEFLQKEKEKKSQNSAYQIRSCIELIVELNVKQYSKEENVDISDNKYRLGTKKIINTDTFHSCDSISSSCKEFSVLDADNLENDISSTYIMNPNHSQTAVTYNNLTSVQTNDLTAASLSDILLAISKDIHNSKINIPNISSRIVGKIDEPTRKQNIINKVINAGGTITFSKQQFPFLDTDSCYWLADKYGSNKAFAIREKDENTLEIYGENISSTCKFVPIVSIKKEGTINE